MTVNDCSMQSVFINLRLIPNCKHTDNFCEIKDCNLFQKPFLVTRKEISIYRADDLVFLDSTGYPSYYHQGRHRNRTRLLKMYCK